MGHPDSFGARAELEIGGSTVGYFSLQRFEDDGKGSISRLPFTIKVLLEAALRAEDGVAITADDVRKLATYDPQRPARVEIPFKPARVLVQDFTGVPAVVDLAALRSAMKRMGGDPERVNPEIPVDLVIDHSVQVDAFGSGAALAHNADLEFQRNRERYEFLHWGQKAFDNFTVVPPATGICHQVNLEYLGKVVQRRSGSGTDVVFPDSLVGLDSHTTMINALGILGWGVGGIEAEAVMLGQPLFMLMPEVVGFRVNGALSAGTTATDLALAVTQILRHKGVVGKFVEFFGSGLSSMSLPDRATIANMAPEYGATCGFFPVDEETLRYLRSTGRPAELIDLVERYSKAQGMFRDDETADPEFIDVVELDLSTVTPSVAGPKRPQDRIALDALKQSWNGLLRAPGHEGGYALPKNTLDRTVPVVGSDAEIGHGSVVVAAITSCTNTSNPSVLLAAGLLARKAVEAGLQSKPWVKTSLAPGSKVVTEYLTETGLLPYFEHLGFNIVGYGCTTCIGNSGPLPEAVSDAVVEGELVVASVLSGNRNFEGRIHQQVKANFLASPPLVVAYALAGNVGIDLTREPLGQGKDGQDVFLKDIWPRSEEIAALLDVAADPEKFKAVYARLLVENETWNAIEAGSEAIYDWDENSTYIHEPSFFKDMTPEASPIRAIEGARVLALLGDSVTTDHISPAGAFPADSEAGKFLISRGVDPQDFNSYGSRRGNDLVMTRGTFANIRLRNALASGKEGGYTEHLPSGEQTTIFDAAQRYQRESTPLVVIGGVDYGMGSSRDWAAKGSFLLGVKAVLAKSFERIHRSNLVFMGVLPLEFRNGEDAGSHGLTGRETFNVRIDDSLQPGQDVDIEVTAEDGERKTITLTCRIDTPVELTYFRNGGILHTVLRKMLKS